MLVWFRRLPHYLCNYLFLAAPLNLRELKLSFNISATSVPVKYHEVEYIVSFYSRPKCFNYGNELYNP